MFRAFGRHGERDFEDENKKGLSAVIEKNDLLLQLIWALIFISITVFLSYYISKNFFFQNPEQHKAFIWMFVILMGGIVLLICFVRFLIRTLGSALNMMEEDRLIMNNVVGGTIICHFDDSFTIKSATPMFYKMFGYKKGDVKKKYRAEFSRMLVGENAKHEFARQKRILREKGTADAQYKISGGSGNPIWVSSRSQLTKNDSNEPVVYMVLFDISSEKQALEKLALAEARNRLVLEKTECFIFEWNIIKDTFEASDLFIKRFGIKEDACSDKSVLTKLMHDDDIDKFKEHIRELEDGEVDNFEIIVKLMDTSGVYTHNTLTLTSVRDNNFVPVRAIGVVVNVEEQYRKEKELRARAAHDSLTGLYNKGATEQMIESAITGHSNQNHAMIIIDVDDFKTVNDTLGHAAGDEALKIVSKTLSEEFDKSDIVGRIGGDEFMVFAVNIGENSKRVTAALDRIKNRDMTTTAGGKSIHLTLSVGISQYKHDADNYVGLFKKADIALYKSKQNGKDQYTVYSSEL